MADPTRSGSGAPDLPQRSGRACPRPIRSVLVVANPVAGRGRATRRAASLAAALEDCGTRARLVETGAPGHLERALPDWLQEHRPCAVVVVGGDGTLHEFLQGLPAPDAVPWTALQAGTGNTLAAELGLPRDPRLLARSLAADAPPPVLPMRLGLAEAVGVAARRRFALFAGFGLDAEAIARLEEVRGDAPLRTGRAAWAAALFHVWRAWNRDRAPRYRIAGGGCGPGGPDDPAYDQVLVTRVSRYGGALRLMPRREHDARSALASPRLVVLAAHVRSRLRAVRLGLGAFAGRLGGTDRTVVDVGGGDPLTVAPVPPTEAHAAPGTPPAPGAGAAPHLDGTLWPGAAGRTVRITLEARPTRFLLASNGS